jgi:hypothetical protein
MKFTGKNKQKFARTPGTVETAPPLVASLIIKLRSHVHPGTFFFIFLLFRSFIGLHVVAEPIMKLRDLFLCLCVCVCACNNFYHDNI